MWALRIGAPMKCSIQYDVCLEALNLLLEFACRELNSKSHTTRTAGLIGKAFSSLLDMHRGGGLAGAIIFPPHSHPCKKKHQQAAVISTRMTLQTSYIHY